MYQLKVHRRNRERKERRGGFLMCFMVTFSFRAPAKVHSRNRERKERSGNFLFRRGGKKEQEIITLGKMVSEKYALAS
jgi:hypothetical protein